MASAIAEVAAVSIATTLRQAADEVEQFPHPSHCDHLHVAFKVMREAAAEIERLTAGLKTANDNAERFEREWYLRGDALEWYGNECRTLADNLRGGAHTQAVLASLTVLSLDAGRRADSVADAPDVRLRQKGLV